MCCLSEAVLRSCLWTGSLDVWGDCSIPRDDMKVAGDAAKRERRDL